LLAALKKCDQQLGLFKDVPAVQAVIHALKGDLYMAQRDKTKAQEAYKAALGAQPDYLPPYYALARILLSDNKQEEAIAQYKAALEKNPNQAGPHMLIGTIYDMQKKHDLSKEHYRSALKINPDFAPAANNLAYLLAEKGENLDEALGLAQKAKEKLSQDPGVMDTLGWIYFKKGLYDSAIGELSESAEKLPDNPVVFYHLGMAHLKKGDKEKARQALEKALALSKDFDQAAEARKVLTEL